MEDCGGTWAGNPAECSELNGLFHGNLKVLVPRELQRIEAWIVKLQKEAKTLSAQNYKSVEVKPLLYWDSGC